MKLNSLLSLLSLHTSINKRLMAAAEKPLREKRDSFCSLSYPTPLPAPTFHFGSRLLCYDLESNNNLSALCRKEYLWADTYRKTQFI